VSSRAPSGISCSIARGIAWLTLNRPRRGNRIDLAAAQALCDAAEATELDDSVAVVVLRGRGPSFCLGVDEGGPWERQHDWVDAVARLTRPTIAAINGDAVAEGFELAMACDLRIAARGARFCLPQLSEGRLPSHGATQRLPRLVGRMRALDLLLSGRAVRAAEAEAMGLVSRAVAAGDLETAVRREVADLRRKGPIALRLAKEAVLKSFDLTLDQGIRLEQDLYVLLQTTADRSEGVRAFLEKRQPRFRGR
jgi:enoyl-CoA hydratase/carnithine racemase